jgi:hypothetical protein
MRQRRRNAPLVAGGRNDNARRNTITDVVALARADGRPGLSGRGAEDELAGVNARDELPARETAL